MKYKIKLKLGALFFFCIIIVLRFPTELLILPMKHSLYILNEVEIAYMRNRRGQRRYNRIVWRFFEAVREFLILREIGNQGLGWVSFRVRIFPGIFRLVTRTFPHAVYQDACFFRIRGRLCLNYFADFAAGKIRFVCCIRTRYSDIYRS